MLFLLQLHHQSLLPLPQHRPFLLVQRQFHLLQHFQHMQLRLLQLLLRKRQHLFLLLQLPSSRQFQLLLLLKEAGASRLFPAGGAPIENRT